MSVLLTLSAVPSLAFALPLALGSFLWGLLAFGLVLICLLLITIILIQDPKGGGLTSAFGAGPGGDSLLGARAQRDVTVWTSWLTLAFLVISFVLVLFDPDKRESAGDIGAGADTTELMAPPAVDGGATPTPGTTTPKTTPADPDAGGAGDQ